jgi:hypothetical protein
VLQGLKQKHRLRALVLAATLFAASSATAAGFGPRLGLTGDPDQVHMGFHVDAARMAPNLGFMPSFEVGVGNDLTLFSANFDFKYAFRTRTAWRPYMGGGPALHFVRFDSNTEDTAVGFAFFGGMQSGTRSGAFFTEMRLGMVDSPDFKFTVGWLFR